MVFNLSDKIFNDALDIRDVQEFIKLLKEVIRFNFPCIPFKQRKILGEIDKLAGKDLIINIREDK